MNIMLLLVVGASFAIVQIATALVVLGLVLFNVVMGTNQELKARASVEALAKLQVPHARVRRSGQVEQIESTRLVPGDIVLLEAGDVVPADGRILSSATLEVQEAALTGESAPVPKDAGTLPDGDVALGDRTNLVFQNTQVTRGTATVVVTATGGPASGGVWLAGRAAGRAAVGLGEPQISGDLPLLAAHLSTVSVTTGSRAVPDDRVWIHGSL
jgi:Ca2+-transporting ATPase